MDKSIFDPSSFILGSCLMSLVWTFIYYPGWGSKYKELMMYTESLISLQEGVVSVSDLAFKAGISPTKARKFLKKLSRQLEVEPEVDKFGIIYYRFRTGKEISAQRQLMK